MNWLYKLSTINNLKKKQMCNNILNNITIMKQSIIMHLITLNLINLIY